MRIRTTLAGALVAAVVAVGVGPVSAATTTTDPVKLDRSPTEEEWSAGRVACLLTVTGTSASGELLHGDPSCWLVEKGDTTPPWTRTGTATPSSDLVGVVDGAASTFADFTVVGTHYDNTNWTGSYITVAGTVCSSGWLNLSADWINRIGSTSSPCWVGHYDGYNLTGSSQWGSFISLTFMNNASNSLVYT